MNKIIISTLYFFVSTFFCFAQSDKFWVVGRNCNLDFRTGICKPDSANNTNQLILPKGCTNICDNNGNLIFFSNSYNICNRNYQPMTNGTNFNHGTYANTYIANNDIYPIHNGAIIIPFVNDTNKYYMFYENAEYTDNGSGLPDRLQYLVVDKTLNGGLGDVTAKDQVIIQGDSLMAGSVYAIKHGNGKDWWIIARKFHSNQFYMILVDSGGPHSPIIQHLGSPYMLSSVYHCDAHPSVDGTKLNYIYECFNTSPILYPGQLDIYDFNRCTGALSNYKMIPMSDSKRYDTFFAVSTCFSPNNRFIYIINGIRMYQLDLQKSNPYKTKINVGDWDGTAAPSNTLFWKMKNGPDGKIYVSTYGGTQYIHVINKPDLLDTFCNFKQKQILFGTLGYYGHTSGEAHFSDGGLPNTPNFALGAIAPCGNVGVAEVKQEELKIKNLYGVGEVLFLPSTLQYNSVLIYDVYGREVYKNTSNKNDFLFTHGGIYFYQLQTNNTWHSGKIVVQ